MPHAVACKLRMRGLSCIHWAIQQWYVRYLPDAAYSTPISWQGIVCALTELILICAIGQLVRNSKPDPAD